MVARGPDATVIRPFPTARKIVLPSEPHADLDKDSHLILKVEPLTQQQAISGLPTCALAQEGFDAVIEHAIAVAT
jgi:hypothetical protein